MGQVKKYEITDGMSSNDLDSSGGAVIFLNVCFVLFE